MVIRWQVCPPKLLPFLSFLPRSRCIDALTFLTFRSSTGQAVGEDSDLLLEPVKLFPDPLRGDDDFLVVCEVLNPDGTPHEDNTRRLLVNTIDDKVKQEEPLYGMEQGVILD